MVSFTNFTDQLGSDTDFAETYFVEIYTIPVYTETYLGCSHEFYECSFLAGTNYLAETMLTCQGNTELKCTVC